MSEQPAGRVHLVVAGVSGSGKSTIASAIADRFGWPFAEGDDFHPPANVAKMRAGTALTDADRGPWLDALVAWTTERDGDGESTVLACSALRRGYRDRLAAVPGTRFCVLQVDAEVLRRRLVARSAQSNHFMPVSLLHSQLATLEPLQADEPGLMVDATRRPEEVVEEVAGWLQAAPEEASS